MKAFCLAAALLPALASTPAAAQDAWRNDVFGGYSVLPTEADTLHGWHAALAWRLSGRGALLVDASGHHGEDGAGTDLSVLSLMAGPRATFGAGRLRWFVQLVAGAVRSTAGLTVFAIEISESATNFAVAAGGGIDVGFGGRWALRLAADYRVDLVGRETASDPRFSAGVAYRFGRR